MKKKVDRAEVASVADQEVDFVVEEGAEAVVAEDMGSVAEMTGDTHCCLRHVRQKVDKMQLVAS